MAEHPPFQHAVDNPSVRRDIALAVRDGIDPRQLAAEFNISVSTVRSYAAEWEGAQRILSTDDFTRGAIIAGCRRGSRARWERQYGAAAIAEIPGEQT